MKGYKAFNKDLTCKGFQYEIGQTYEIKENPRYCEKGFHFCKTIADVYNYYPMSDNTRICEVEAIGVVDTYDNVKYCTNKIVILKEIEDAVVKHCNTDRTTNGYCNTGNSNTGNSNTGNSNTGNKNTGDSNTGNKNTGDKNKGYCNTGNKNTGDRNTGCFNTGHKNTGYYNTGHYNTGNCNTGNYNTGSKNTGNWNTGYYNTGNKNTGDFNAGNWNTGCYNTGNGNTGDWNAGNYNTGCFNTHTETFRFFNKESDFTQDNWMCSEAREIMSSCPEKCMVEWVNESKMTETEKKENSSYKTTGGYLMVVDLSETRQFWWDSLCEEEKNCVISLPNFDPHVFYECTGIKVKM